MGRIDFLMKTLMYNLNLISKYEGCELVLLDYNSKDGLEDWIRDNFSSYIHSGVLVYCKTTEPQHFHMSHAKNLVHRLASGDILCNLDADNFLDKKYLNLLVSCTEKDNQFIIKARGDGYGSGGRISVSRDLFYTVRGYEEHIDRWGHDDTDFFNKCELFGGEVIPYVRPVRVIHHNDQIRGGNYDKEFNRAISREWEGKLKRKIKMGELHSNLLIPFGKGTVRKNFSENVTISEDITNKVYAVERYKLVYNTGLVNHIFVYPELGTYAMTIINKSIKKLNCFWFDKGKWERDGNTIRMKWFWHNECVLQKEPHSEKYRCGHYFIKRKY
jgi:hypothetical protein